MREQAFLLEVDWSVSHAGGDTKGSCDSRQDADDDLNNGLPSFFVFHFLSG